MSQVFCRTIKAAGGGRLVALSPTICSDNAVLFARRTSFDALGASQRCCSSHSCPEGPIDATAILDPFQVPSTYPVSLFMSHLRSS
jgi:hypothetical protein